jgi:hypothetical protein
MNDIIAEFKKRYSNLIDAGLEVTGLATIMDTVVIAGSRPFVFDAGKIPLTFEGYDVRINPTEPFPKEFDVEENIYGNVDEYIWAPERFEKFVDRCADEIRKELGNLSMTRAEMLDALIGGSFREHKQRILEAVAKDELPAYKED